MEYQPWNRFGQRQQQSPEDDKTLCRSLIRLLLEQSYKQEIILTNEMWQELRQNVLGHSILAESLTQFVNRYPHIFTCTELISQGEVLVKINFSLSLCKDHLIKGCHNLYCGDLHCCKFYLYGVCKFRDNCSFGHDLKTGWNKAILDNYMLTVVDDREEEQQPKNNHNVFTPSVGITVSEMLRLMVQESPRICKFYNSDGGCKHGQDGRKCPALHLCKQYIMHGYCTESCPLTHDIYAQQPTFLLTKHGYDVTPSNKPYILQQLQLDEPSSVTSTPVKRASPQLEQLQHEAQRYRHHYGQQQKVPLYRYTPGVMQEMPDHYNYYGGMDVYESDDACWSSQESRYCFDNQHHPYYQAANDASDCENSIVPSTSADSPYSGVKRSPITKSTPGKVGAHSIFPLLKQKDDLKVCPFYNTERGCRYTEAEYSETEIKPGSSNIMDGPNMSTVCQNLHLCYHFVSGSCLFKANGTSGGTCRRSHDLRSKHTRNILERYYINVNSCDDKTILTAIRQKLSQQVKEKDDISASSSSSMERLSLDEAESSDASETPKPSVGDTVVNQINGNCVPKQKINTFVFIDLEATGLVRPKITELSLVCIHRYDLEESIRYLNTSEGSSVSKHEYMPRVINKLTLCVSPGKDIDPEASRMTGLSTELLRHQRLFNRNLVDILATFLTHLSGPACLVAHNGLRFDFTLLKAELSLIGRLDDLPTDLLCLDSLTMFRSVDEKTRLTAPAIQSRTEPEKILTKPPREPRTDWWGVSDDEVEQTVDATTSSTATASFGVTHTTRPSYKLSEVHLRATGHYPVATHRAEDDALALIRCFICTPGCLEWADVHAMPFSHVVPMHQYQQ